jgi:hypothetical protein
MRGLIECTSRLTQRQVMYHIFPLDTVPWNSLKPCTRRHSPTEARVVPYSSVKRLHEPLQTEHASTVCSSLTIPNVGSSLESSQNCATEARGVPYSSVKRMHEPLHKATYSHSLKQFDNSKRGQFYRCITELLQLMDIPNVTVCSNRALSHLSGCAIPSNSSVLNPHELMETSLHQHKVPVWCEILQSQVTSLISHHDI